MSTLQKIAWYQGRRDEVPNKELAENKDEVLAIIELRRPEFTAAHEKRMKKVLKQIL